MFVGKARSLHYIGAPESCFTRVGSTLSHKQEVRMEKIAKDKHSSLTLGARIIKLIMAVIYSFRNKLECLSLASLSSLVYCLM